MKNINNDNSSKTVVVTGASRGLGAAIALALNENGYSVIGLSRSGEAIHKDIEARSCDVGDASQVQLALKDVAKNKALWGLINAAGIASMNLTMMTPFATVEKILRTNLIGTINPCIALSKQFARNKAGRIINFSTIAVPISLKGEAIYVASKAGVEGFSRTFAREMADFNVTVNIIAPGPIDTNLISSVPKEAIQKIIERQVIQKKFDKSAITKLVLYLLSEESEMLSGQIFNVGGV